MSQSLILQPHNPSMLSGSVLALRAIWALEFGLAEGVLFSQLHYRANGFPEQGGASNVRFSYTKLQKQLPFFSRRWIIELVTRLEASEAIHVIRGEGVNQYTLNGKKTFVTDYSEKYLAALLIFPELACRVGLIEALILQQIHIRHHLCDGSVWTVKAFQEWHSDVFMFLSISTVKRAFAQLRKKGLIFVGTYNSDRGVVGKYRVNYLGLAECLGGIPIQTHPAVHNQTPPKDWTDPLYPLKTKEKSSGCQSSTSSVSTKHYSEGLILH